MNENNDIENKTFHGFLWIFSSQYFSLIGSQIVSFAVIWYLTELTGSTLILSIASIVSIVPMIIISPFAGVITDRANKNKILLITDAIQAVATLVLIFLFSLNIIQMWHIISLLGVRGICQGFQNPVTVSVLPIMVPEDKLKTMNSINQICRSLLSIASPAIGAIVLSFFTIESIYLLDVFTFIPSALVLLFIRIPSVRKQEPEKELTLLQDFTEGFKYIKKSGLSPIFIMFAASNFLVWPCFSLFSLLVLDYHGGAVINYSWMEILYQIGIIGGSFLLLISKKKGSMKSVILGTFMLPFLLILIALVPGGNWVIFYIICFLLGTDLAYIDTQLMSVLQTNIPKYLQGRVFSTMFTISKSINPIGLILLGILGEFISINLLYIIGPTISICIYCFLLKYSKIGHYDKIQEENLKQKLKIHI